MSCHIEGCDNQARGHGLCSTHWLRWRKWEDPYWVEPKKGVRPHNFRQATCSIDGCDASHHAHGFCSAHASAFRKYGDPLAVGTPGRKRLDQLTWAGAHKRVRYDRGRASEHACIDCGQRAEEWSCRHDIPEDSRQQGWSRPNRNGVRSWQTWSTDVWDYDPRCRKCHRRYDASWLTRSRDQLGRFSA